MEAQLEAPTLLGTDHASRKIWLVKVGASRADTGLRVHARTRAACTCFVLLLRAALDGCSVAQVPQFVAERWRGVCDQAAQNPSSAPGPVLGTLTWGMAAGPNGAAVPDASVKLQRTHNGHLVGG